MAWLVFKALQPSDDTICLIQTALFVPNVCQDSCIGMDFIVHCFIFSDMIKEITRQAARNYRVENASP